LGQLTDAPPQDTFFAVLHGLYWLSTNLAGLRPLLVAVDDAHWGDEPSLRWLAYLAPRLEGLPLALVLTLRPSEPSSLSGPLLALRAEAPLVLRPERLSESAVSAIVRDTVGDMGTDELGREAWTATGGNPLYLTELLRAIEIDDQPLADCRPAELLAGGHAEI